MPIIEHGADRLGISHGSDEPTQLLPATLSARAFKVGLGANRAAARGCAIPDDSGREEERAAGGLGRDAQLERARRAHSWHERALTHWTERRRSGHCTCRVAAYRCSEPRWAWPGGAVARETAGQIHPSLFGLAPGPHPTPPAGPKLHAGESWRG
jgi:hypothetical protein